MIPSRYCKICGCYIPDDWEVCPANSMHYINETNELKSKTEVDNYVYDEFQRLNKSIYQIPTVKRRV